MRVKATLELIEEAKRLRKQGLSCEAIAETLSKPGKPIHEESVRRWLKKENDARRVALGLPKGAELPPPDLKEPAPSASSPVALPLTAPDEPEEPVEMSPDELRRVLSSELKRAKADADIARAAGDLAAARAASKIAGIFAGHLRQIHSKQDEDTDTIRIKAGDVDAAAERALTGLRQLADRVASERAEWPRCPSCGQGVGRFANGDKSPLRVMFERVVTGG